jgi:AcrR family transcriptional regulator
MPINAQQQNLPAIKRIMDAAILEFGRKGEDATRIDDIAARAGISKQLVYHYYGTKHALYSDVIEEICNVEHAKLLTLKFQEMEPIEAILLFFSTILETNIANTHLLSIDQILHHDDSLNGKKAVGRYGRLAMEKLNAIVARGQLGGQICPRVSAPQLFLHMLLLSTGFATFRVMMPGYTGHDFSGLEAEKSWRAYALASIRAAVAA